MSTLVAFAALIIIGQTEPEAPAPTEYLLSQIAAQADVTVLRKGTYCVFEFGDEFGRRDDHRDMLVAMAFEYERVTSDLVNCPFLWNYDALDHLYYRATAKSDPWAARMILEGAGRPMEGEFADVYPDHYLWPLLGAVPLIERVLPDQTDGLVLRLCSWRMDYMDSRFRKRTLRHLRSGPEKARRLAAAVVRFCPEQTD